MNWTKDWPRLIDRIKTGKCVPIIGAGASIPHVPSAKEMAEILLEEHERKMPEIRCPNELRNDLSKVAQFLAVAHKDGRIPKESIAQLVTERSKAPSFPDDDPHLALARLNLPIYITTNYDNRMKLALERELGNKGTVSVEYCRWNDELRNKRPPVDSSHPPSRDHPLVFHLHGKMDEIDSLVASEDDYLEFLTEMVKRTSSQKVESGSAGSLLFLPAPLQGALANNLLLFVGYSIYDINFRLILRGLKTTLQPYKRINITVQYDGDKNEDLKKYLTKYYDFTLSLEVYWGSAACFCAELLNKILKKEQNA